MIYGRENWKTKSRNNFVKKRVEILEKREKNKKIRSIFNIIIIILIVVFSIIYAYKFYGMMIDLVNQI